MQGNRPYMPELPEIETLRRDLSELIVGKAIRRASVRNPRSIRAHSTFEEFEEPLAGATVMDVNRKGKFLSITMGSRRDTRFALVAHMGMTGQLRNFSFEEEIPKHSHVRLQFMDDTQVVFVDPRTFGQLYLDRIDDSGLAASLRRLGVDPINEPGMLLQALKRFSDCGVGVKWLLLDQSQICGIGNMYADEILFRAGIRFDRFGRSLTLDEFAGLAGAIKDILSQAIVLRGSSLKDLQYRDVNGLLGGYQDLHQVYGREGLECFRCEGIIERIFAKGRSCFLCSSCQR